MGNVFKKTVTRPLPPNAEIITRQGVRLARWRDGKGKTKTAPVTTGKDGAERIRDESGTYVARYRDGDGIVVEVSTGCRDKTAAQNVLADLERKAERVRAGLLTPAEARTAEHLATPIGEHVDAYLNALDAAGSVTAMHRTRNSPHPESARRRLRLPHARRPEAAKSSSHGSPAKRQRANASARSRNTHRTVAHRLRQLVRQPNIGRLVVESVQGGAEGRREGRPSPPPPVDDRSRACAIARRRPRPTPARSHDGAKGQEEGASHRQSQARSARAARSGRPRASPDLQDTGAHRTPKERTGDPDASLNSGSTSRSPTSISTRPTRRTAKATTSSSAPTWRKTFEPGSPTSSPSLQADALRRGEPIPARLPGDCPVFDVPTGSGQDLRSRPESRRHREARRAGPHSRRACIANDVRHALGQGGGSLANGSSRHATFRPELTANVYTDPKLLDVHGALDALPSLPLDAGPTGRARAARATGTETYARSFVAPPLH